MNASSSLKAVFETALSSLPCSAPVLLLATVDVEKNFDLSSLLRQAKVFTNHNTLEFPPPVREERVSFFAPIAGDVKTWRKHPKIAAPPPKLEKEEMPQVSFRLDMFPALSGHAGVEPADRKRGVYCAATLLFMRWPCCDLRGCCAPSTAATQPFRAASLPFAVLSRA